MPEWVTLAGLVIGAAIVMGILKSVGPRLKSAGGPAGDKAESAGQAVAGVFATIVSWLPLAVGFLVLAVVARWWIRRRARQRAEQLHLLGAVLSRLMPADWSVRSLVVSRWRGVRPVRVEWPLTSSTADHEPDWRQKVEAALVLRLGVPWLDVQWPEGLKRRVRVIVPSAEAVETHHAQEAARVAAEEAAEAERLALEEGERLLAEQAEAEARAVLETEEGRLFLALDGLVPDARVEVTGRTDAGDMSEITLRYGETNRDISPNWRGRVLLKVTQRFGGQWRSEWNTQERRVVLRAVPELPHPVKWRPPSSWEDVKYGSAPIGVYGVTEEGHVIGHELGPRQPHALVVGQTGTGKTETMKAQMASLMLQGVIQVVIAPKPEDWVVFLGMPGVAAVATSVEDRAELIVAVWKQMHRRVSAGALRHLRDLHPHMEIDLPELAEIDRCYMQIVIDEVTQNIEDLTAWWNQKSPDEKKELVLDWGTGSHSSKTPPQEGMLKEIAQLARSARIHLLEGMQRADGENFGENTQMRDNFPNRTTMGSMSPIGSEQVWGDRQTGVIPIKNVGEGMTNGARFHRSVEVGVGVAVRYKGVYISDSELLSEAFQESVAAVAPDVSLLDLGNVSAETRSISAAAMGLRKRAGYGLGTGGGSVDLDHDRRQRRRDAVQDQVPPAAESPATESTAIPASDGPVQDAPAPGAPAEEKTAPSASVQDAPTEPTVFQATVETDAAGHIWDPVRPLELKVKDVISVAEIERAVVVSEPEHVEDDLSGDPVIRVVLKVDGAEQEYDLDPDDQFHRLRKGK